MTFKWSDKEEEVLKWLAPHCTCSEISQIFRNFLGIERTPEAIQHKREDFRIKFLYFGSMGILPQDKSVPAEEIQIWLLNKRTGVKEIPRPISSSDKAQITKNRSAEAQMLLDSLQELQVEIRPTNFPRSPKTSNDSICFLLSDFHMGKIIKNEDQTPLYNIEIARNRINSIPRKACDITSRFWTNADEAVILLAGDLVDGEGVYPGQEANIEVGAGEQSKIVTKSIWQLTRDLKQQFKQVKVVTCPGNHGKGETSNQTNWDNIVYGQLELLIDLHQDKGISIRNIYKNWNTYEVKGHKGLLRHKAPVQADTPSALSKFAGWHNIYQYDIMNFGHWHHPGIFFWNNIPIIRNGCLCGGDDYAEMFGAHDNPKQLVFGISEKQGLTFITTIEF
jgi:predicted MPP superfamily phosphohydrolase